MVYFMGNVRRIMGTLTKIYYRGVYNFVLYFVSLTISRYCIAIWLNTYILFQMNSIWSMTLVLKIISYTAKY